MKSTRSRGKRDIIHGIFLSCREYCPNDYWKGVFEDLAYGKYPKQIYVSSGMIQSSNRKKISFCYSIKDKPPLLVAREVIQLLTENTDLISSDEIQKKKDIHENYKKDTWHQWKDIKRKYIKDVLLMEYCLELRKDYGWTLKRATDIYQELTLRIYGGQITDIRLDGGRIQEIIGMQISPTGEISFDAGEFRQEQVYPLEDYIYNYCKRYVNRNSKVNDS
jgi:hypothetical protein